MIRTIGLVAALLFGAATLEPWIDPERSVSRGVAGYLAALYGTPPAPAPHTTWTVRSMEEEIAARHRLLLEFREENGRMPPSLRVYVWQGNPRLWPEGALLPARP